MSTPGGLAAPTGYHWCRGERADGSWHLIPSDELAHRGRKRPTGESACGLVASFLPSQRGWSLLQERVAITDRLCAACIGAVAQRRKLAREAAPASHAQAELPL